MEQAQTVGAATSAGAARPAARRWRRFHLWISGALLVFVVIGFAPSFYLRPAFTDRPLPFYLYAHGTVLTLWFSLAFAQAALVARRRTALHRRLGIAGGIIAAAVVPLSALVAVRAIPRFIAAGVGSSDIQFIVLGDLISLVVFTGLVAAALAWRRDREWHRRLMTVASVMIIGPAVARFERIGLALPVPAVLLGLLVLIGINDTLERGRPHRATLISGGIVVVALGALLLTVDTRLAAMLIERLNP